MCPCSQPFSVAKRAEPSHTPEAQHPAKYLKHSAQPNVCLKLAAVMCSNVVLVPGLGIGSCGSWEMKGVASKDPWEWQVMH